MANLLSQASAVALRHKAQPNSQLKRDGSIVTDADLAVEEFLRVELGRLTPDCSFFGEEMGQSALSDLVWAIDPIDGTSNFAFGQPLWGVTFGLLENRRLVAGAMTMPELGHSFVAAAGAGAYHNGERMPALAPGRIHRHELMQVGSSRLVGDPRIPGKERLLGSFVVEAAFMCMGQLRAVVTEGVMLWDLAGAVCILREQGAEVRFLDGSLWDEADALDGTPQRALAILPPESGFPFGDFRRPASR